VAAAKTLTLGRTLNNAGVATWTAGQISHGSGRDLQQSGGRELRDELRWELRLYIGGAIPQFNNAGTFTKSGWHGRDDGQCRVQQLPTR
jgi:hypothetical protein